MLEDVNDEIPLFTEREQETVLEGEPVGSKVTQVNAIDKDGTFPNNQVNRCRGLLTASEMYPGTYDDSDQLIAITSSNHLCHDARRARDVDCASSAILFNTMRVLNSPIMAKGKSNLRFSRANPHADASNPVFARLIIVTLASSFAARAL
jgi:hypothetical protein